MDVAASNSSPIVPARRHAAIDYNTSAKPFVRWMVLAVVLSHIVLALRITATITMGP